LVWKIAERKDFRARFVGECEALVVAETPRKPAVEQVGALTDIIVRRHPEAALLSLRQGNRAGRMAGPIVDAAAALAHGSIVSKAGTTDTTT
jgi:hypothetical protein